MWWCYLLSYRGKRSIDYPAQGKPYNRLALSWGVHQFHNNIEMFSNPTWFDIYHKHPTYCYYYIIAFAMRQSMCMSFILYRRSLINIPGEKKAKRNPTKKGNLGENSLQLPCVLFAALFNLYLRHHLLSCFSPSHCLLLLKPVVEVCTRHQAPCTCACCCCYIYIYIYILLLGLDCHPTIPMCRWASTLITQKHLPKQANKWNR